MNDAPSDLRERYERLQALHTISTALNSTLDPRDLLKLVLSEAVRVTKADSGSVVLINPNTGRLDIEEAVGLGERVAEVKLRLGEGITGWVAKSGRPLRVGDVNHDPRYVAVREGVRSELAVPLEFEGQVQGVLNVDSDRPDAFSAADEELLIALAAQAARVLHNAWLIRQLRQRAAQLETLITIGRDILSPLTLDEVLQRVVREARRLMNARLSSLLLLTPDREELELRASDGAGEDYVRRPNLKVCDCLLGVVVRHKRPLTVANVQESDQYRHTELARKEGLVSLLSVPLTSGGDAIGVLSVYTAEPHRFSNDDILLLTALASLGSVAVRKAQLYEKIVDAEEQLRQNERLSALGLLAAEIAHEIRNPLTVVKMLFHSLDLQFPAGDPRARDVAIIQQKMEQMNRVLDQTLTFARRSEPRVEPADLNALLDDVLLLVRHKLAQHNIVLQWQPAAHLPAVPLDRTQIEQAALNLILNATQAMPSGGTLTIATRAEDAEVCVTVADTGVGMTPEVQQRLFDLFLTSKPAGTGLGLALVRKIIEAHRGRIEVESAPRKGTTFSLFLPTERG
ncbi:MAG: GAF domain-containing protein [Verrucomicrobiae bacterium]|nr:GAF domain-containing protein [Verrucomicrobiae bacterium]